MKKRIFRFAAAFAFVIAIVPGCDLLDNCGNCSLVTYSGGDEISRSPELPYCDEDYEKKLDDPGTYIGNNWAIWECD